MSDATSNPQSGSPSGISPSGKPWKLKFDTVDQVKEQVQKLKSTPHQSIGQWTLPQISRHVGRTITENLIEPESTTPTADEAEAWNGFAGIVRNPMGMPDNMGIGKGQAPTDCTDTDVDELLAALDALEAYPLSHVKVGRCGPVPKDDVVHLHLVHAGHHLSFLTTEPEKYQTPGPMLDKPVGRRSVEYADEVAALADLAKLRGGPYFRTGNWTLGMIAAHVNAVARGGPQAPASSTPTREQAESQKFIRHVLQHKGPPPGTIPPPQFMPPLGSGPACVDELEQFLKRMTEYKGSHVDMGPMGPVPTDQYRKLHLLHLGHHLGFLVPMT